MSIQRLPETESNDTPLLRGDVVFRVHPRARRYLARVDREANIVLTVPYAGSQRGALAFANLHRAWLRDQQVKARAALADPELQRGLRVGDLIWYRGRKEPLRLEKDWGRPVLCFGDQRLFIADEGMDLSRPLKAHLRGLAKQELPERTRCLGGTAGAIPNKVVVRDQKTRWGSCSTGGTISLNWRLLLASEGARDYVILHELMHLKRFDHSPAFWKLVERECPEYREHEAWLQRYQQELSW